MTTPRLRRCQGQLRRTFSVILDAILLLSLCCLLYVLLGGHVRWTTSLFRVTMANIGGPLKVFTFTMMMKGVFGLTSGILVRSPVSRCRSSGAYLPPFIKVNSASLTS